jgi:hypothetical protein
MRWLMEFDAEVLMAAPEVSWTYKFERKLDASSQIFCRSQRPS